jgi:hypothetical protein
MNKEIFMAIAGGITLATGLIFYGIQNRSKDQDQDDDTFDELVCKDDDEEEEEEIKEEVKPRQKRKYTKRNIQGVKTNTKRRK